MTAYRRGDVVLVPFPFADRLAAKRRPAVIVSTEAYHAASQEVIIAQVTSRIGTPARPGDHLIQGWQEAGLLAPSLARARLATIHTSLVLRRLGALAPADLHGVDQGLRQALEL